MRCRQTPHDKPDREVDLTLTTDAQTSGALDRSIETFICTPHPVDADFERLALELFAYQYANNAPYRALCDQRGCGPRDVASWSDVPAISAASFGDARLACFPPERTRLRFVSSGTTRAGHKPSVHELENAQLYDCSLLEHFRRCVLPDRQTIRMLLLSPPFDEAPHSSLSYMLSQVFRSFGAGGGFFIRDGSLDARALTRALHESVEPVLLFGTAFAFVHFLDACAAQGERFALAPGSRVVETGGFKGRSKTVERDELYGALERLFGVDPSMCIAEYGMCELGSQWYDAALADALAGRLSRGQLKVGPHWARTLIVDPVTAQPVESGTAGLLQVFDLSNRGSVAAVLTGDLVEALDGGFRFLGRSAAAPPKGCSITIDGMLR